VRLETTEQRIAKLEARISNQDASMVCGELAYQIDRSFRAWMCGKGPHFMPTDRNKSKEKYIKSGRTTLSEVNAVWGAEPFPYTEVERKEIETFWEDFGMDRLLDLYELCKRDRLDVAHPKLPARDGCARALKACYPHTRPQEIDDFIAVVFDKAL
jgi:hypothetical protein